MNTRFVYLAGPISGCNFDEATNWRQYVSAAFQKDIIGVSPMRLKDWCSRVLKISDVDQYKEVASDVEYLLSGESRAIRTRDFNDVKTADMIFMYLPRNLNGRQPSWGTVIELGWASAQNVPIVLVTDDETLAKHPLVRESVGWIVPDIGTGIAVVNSVLGVYVGADQ